LAGQDIAADVSTRFFERRRHGPIGRHLVTVHTYRS
jgi:hypothetical protein